jgi:hypothetical protein
MIVELLNTGEYFCAKYIFVTQEQFSIEFGPFSPANAQGLTSYLPSRDFVVNWGVRALDSI